MNATSPNVVSSIRPEVRCQCTRLIFDGVVIKSKVVRLLPHGGAEAKCRCKLWVKVPASYQAIKSN